MAGSKSETTTTLESPEVEKPPVAAAAPVKEGTKRPTATKASPSITPDSTLPSTNTAFATARPTEMPDVPQGFFWRVKVYEDENYGTSFQVELRQRLFLGSKKVDSIVTSANKYSAYFQGTTLNDAETLASLARAIWNAGTERGAAISRQSAYATRAKDMKRYAHDYDPQHRLSEILK